MLRKKVAHRSFKVVFQFEAEDGKAAWIVEIPEVPSCHTFGRSLAEARRNIREALAVCLDDEERDAIAEAAIFEEDIRMPVAVRSALRSFTKAQAEAEKSRAKSAEAARAIAEQLSLRDAGELMGLSAETVRKLLKTG